MVKNLSDAQLVARNMPVIELLGRVKNAKTRREILRAGEKLQLAKSICSLCKNYSMGTFGKHGRRGKLGPADQRALADIGSGRLSASKRDKLIVQKGGVIGALAPLLKFALPTLFNIFGGGGRRR